MSNVKKLLWCLVIVRETFDKINYKRMLILFSVRTWGSETDKPIVALHGGLDNVATFNRLIPLLPKSFYYICMEFPGHGKSSPITSFFPNYFFNLVLVLKIILDYFKREKYILLGHSYGAGVAQYIARLYPEYVEKLVAIDCIAPKHIPPEIFKRYVVSKCDATIKSYENSKIEKRNTYTKDEAIEVLRHLRISEPLPFEFASILAERWLEPVGEYICVCLFHPTVLNIAGTTKWQELRSILYAGS